MLTCWSPRQPVALQAALWKNTADMQPGGLTLLGSRLVGLLWLPDTPFISRRLEPPDSEATKVIWDVVHCSWGIAHTWTS